MHIGYIGLGKMGSNMVQRLLDTKHKVTVFDVNEKAVKSLVRKGARGVATIEELVDDLRGPKTVWVMVPQQFVDGVLAQLRPFLKKGDTIIEGGNSPYKFSIDRAKRFKKLGIFYLDVGVSGGPDGARNGACMMVGGNEGRYKKFKTLWRDLCVKDGYGYMGPSGSGHFVKMIHNGIEYGMMQSIAEGFDLMRSSKDFDLDLKSVTKVYAHGSVISSSLIDWLGVGFKKFGTDLVEVSGAAKGLGEGKWTSEFAHQLGVPDKVIHDAVRARGRSRKKPSYQGKVVMVLRHMFGRHDVTECPYCKPGMIKK
jgi:6-phosphogluconate dehydrogenase